MMSDNTTVALRPCCRDARERHGSKPAPMFGPEIGHLFEDDAKVEPIVAETYRSIAVARHEIGHLLVTIALGGSVGNVTVDGQPRAECRLPDGDEWRGRVAVDLAGDGVGWGELPADELSWHLSAVRMCGGGRCDRCNAARRILVGLRHPPDDVVIEEFRRIEAIVADFFTLPEVRALVSEIAWWLCDEGTISGDEILNRFGPQIRTFHLEI